METSLAMVHEEFRIIRNTNVLRGKNEEVLSVKGNGT
jgi:hypothetical protein